MKAIGDTESEDLAERFEQYLMTQGIESEVRPADGDKFRIWVLDQKHLVRSEKLFSRFLADPEDPEFTVSRRRSKPKAEEGRARFVDVRTEVFHRSEGKSSAVTIFLIALCCGVSFLASAQGLSPLVRKFYISEIMPPFMFTEILSGQIWRVVTPILLHSGIIHLGFNMLWLYQLGGQIERYEGSRYLIVLVLGLAVPSNLAQYLMTGPAFGGMSGVVYGLLGYLWMMTKYKVGTRYDLSQDIVVFMLIWLVVCLIGIVGNVANGTHVVGFICGTVWGLLKSGGAVVWLRRLRQR